MPDGAPLHPFPPTEESHVPSPVHRRHVIGTAAVALVLLAGCASPSAQAPSSKASADTPTGTHAGAHADTPSDITEAPAVRPRLVLSHDGGIAVLDAGSLETVGAVATTDRFVRLNAAGDGRHALVSTTGGFQVLDAGTWGEAHGNHTHYFNATPC